MSHLINWLPVRRSAALLALFFAATTASADQIILNNGDRITGTIDSADAGKLIIDSPIEGKITVDLKNVKTFSTDGPIKVVFNDGTVVDERIAEGQAGEFVTVPGTVLPPQTFSISKVGKINPPPVVWTGSIVINGLYLQGDTTAEQFGASINLLRRSDFDRIDAGAAYLFGEQKINGVQSTTADNWYARGEYDYFFTKKFFAYANTRVEKDRIQHLDLRLTPGVGVGYQVFEQPDFNLNFSGGLSWVYEDYSNLSSPNENVSARIAYHVDKSFCEDKVKLFNEVTYFPSVQNVNDYLVLTTSGVHLAITKTMFSELKAEVDYDSHPAPMSHRTNAKYILGVGWTF
jgi:putative salt-induced outer membrane protein YdiY